MPDVPSTKLARVTLYKNELAFIERSARCSAGAKLDQSQRGFKLSVPNKNKDLTMATMAVTAGTSAAIMVTLESKALGVSMPGGSVAGSGQPLYNFSLGSSVDLGNFLASVNGWSGHCCRGKLHTRARSESCCVVIVLHAWLHGKKA